jgi:hypothetical protein
MPLFLLWLVIRLESSSSIFNRETEKGDFWLMRSILASQVAFLPIWLDWMK